MLTLLVLLAFRLTISGAFIVLATALATLGITAAIMVGRTEKIEYELMDRKLLLRRGGSKEELDLDEVLDANLIDFVSARDYLEEHLQAPDDGLPADKAEAQRLMTRFCGVPLAGLAALGTGIYRTNIRNFRQTLVLLRIRDGRAVILSPRYSETMVSAIGKALAHSRAGIN